MTRINIFITFVLSAFLLGCATYNPKYRIPSSKPSDIAPSADSDIEKTFYLIGNAGQKDQASETMSSLAGGNLFAKVGSWSGMPSKSMNIWLYWCPKSGVKLTCS